MSSWVLLFHFHSTLPFSVKQNRGPVTLVPGGWAGAQFIKDIVGLYPRVWIPWFPHLSPPCHLAIPLAVAGKGVINTHAVEGRPYHSTTLVLPLCRWGWSIEKLP